MIIYLLHDVHVQQVVSQLFVIPYVFDILLMVNITHEQYSEYFLYLLDIREKEKKGGG
jgi:hypothetical protein